MTAARGVGKLAVTGSAPEVREPVRRAAPLAERCVYCGRPTSGSVCRAHADLPPLDPLARLELDEQR